MGYHPNVMCAPCPACGADPDATLSGIFNQRVRLQCKCGVSGQWVDYPGYGNVRNTGIQGWEMVAGELMMMSPPPHPRR